MSVSDSHPLRGLLADTWWFSLTSRLPAARFDELARRRVDQGFNAVQLVAGIPPEVGPLNENARSEAGFPWGIDGAINESYLALARERVGRLNALGLRVIVYGAWGHQIAWLGREGMARWWSRLVSAVDDLDVVYCLTGESNLWLGEEDRLLPDRTSANLAHYRALQWLPGRFHGLARRARAFRQARRSPARAAERRAAWSDVLAHLAGLTARAILIHPVPGDTGQQVIDNGHLLAANTIQTGHSEATREAIWQIPLRERSLAPDRLFLNLEPWYEGILGQFGPADQLYACWATLLAGAAGYCYGAHGLWNVGDGRFLAHWGAQTFDEALALETPRLIGLSHRLWRDWDQPGEVICETREGRLLRLGRRLADGRAITFYPRVELAGNVPTGRYWLPLAGEFGAAPAGGPLVVLS